jgi:hypothetical protein
MAKNFWLKRREQRRDDNRLSLVRDVQDHLLRLVRLLTPRPRSSSNCGP